MSCVFVFFNDTSTTEIYTYGHTLSLHDALPICLCKPWRGNEDNWRATSASTRNAKSASSVIRIDCELSSCSACESRSAAIQAGSLSDRKSTRLNSSH